CSGQSKKRDSPWGLIFPFGLNESQLLAVERAFSSQISVIEGPPGTGKTQTILNIVANILIQNKTVAILSNNNSAVSNVYEKMDKQQ
ncbi:TPA: AAA family ATPase, partial [Escherichia coli]|nr:AAA family ATPase [Escherichia coli]